MFALKLAVQLNVNVGKYLIIWPENAFHKVINVQEQGNFTTLHQESAKFGVQMEPFTILKVRLVKWLQTVLLMKHLIE